MGWWVVGRRGASTGRSSRTLSSIGDGRAEAALAAAEPTGGRSGGTIGRGRESWRRGLGAVGGAGMGEVVVVGMSEGVRGVRGDMGDSGSGG